MALSSLQEKIVAGIIGGLTVTVLAGIWRAVAHWLWKVDPATLGTLTSLLANGQYLFESGRGYSATEFSRWQAESEHLLKAVEDAIATGISKKEAKRFMTASGVNAIVDYYGAQPTGPGAEHNRRLNVFRGYLSKLELLIVRYS
jgi:hypothetical protein